MKMQDVIDEVKFELTGLVLETDLDDVKLEVCVNKVLRELTRYWDEITYIKVPFASCIDTSGWDEEVSSIENIYRSEAIGDVEGNGMFDPLYAQQWMIFSSGGTMYNLQDYVLNYAAWSTLQSIKNTMSTDLGWDEDRHNHKLYINANSVRPNMITIAYIPKLKTVDMIKSDYWIDILVRMSVAMAKVAVGRIRTRYKPAGAVWEQDGDTILNEGVTDLKELREILRTESNLIQQTD